MELKINGHKQQIFMEENYQVQWVHFALKRHTILKIMCDEVAVGVDTSRLSHSEFLVKHNFPLLPNRLRCAREELTMNAERSQHEDDSPRVVTCSLLCLFLHSAFRLSVVPLVFVTKSMD
ncbi:hypothetical protein J6590_001077 [Homalodisca vitripennis]|nr:hypothetical protein J6590_001077 [Homalodisca vitripennis]